MKNLTIAIMYPRYTIASCLFASKDIVL